MMIKILPRFPHGITKEARQPFHEIRKSCATFLSRMVIPFNFQARRKKKKRNCVSSWVARRVRNPPLFWMGICLVTKSTHSLSSTLWDHTELCPPFPTWQPSDTRRESLFPSNPSLPKRWCPSRPPRPSRELPQGPHQLGSHLQTLFHYLKILIQLSSCNTIAQLSCCAKTLSKNSGNLLWSWLPSPQNPDPNLLLRSPRTCAKRKKTFWLDIISWSLGWIISFFHCCSWLLPPGQSW